MFSDFLTDTVGEQAGELIGTLLLIGLVLLLTVLARSLVSRTLPRLVHLLARRTRPAFDEQIIGAIDPPLRFAVGVFGLWVALILVELPGDLHDMVNRLMGSLVIVAVFWALYRGIDLAVALLWRIGSKTATLPGANLLDEKLATVARQIGKALVIIFASTAILENWGRNFGGVVAGLGLGGLAVALAAQDALANLIGYFVIVADEPFVPGEYIVMGDIAGTVELIGFRSTRIRALEQSLVVVPNKTLVNASVTNWSRLTKRRLNMTLSVDYSNSPAQVLSVVQAIRDMLKAHPLVQADSVVVQFTEFDTDTLDVMIICFMKTPDWGDFQAARQDINLRIMRILDERRVSVGAHVRPVPAAPAAPGAPTPAPKPVPPLKPEPTVSTATDSPVPSDAAN